jgi:hypothetical protein
MAVAAAADGRISFRVRNVDIKALHGDGGSLLAHVPAALVGWQRGGSAAAHAVGSGPPLLLLRQCCRIPGGVYGHKSRYWTFPVAQHDRLVQALQVGVVNLTYRLKRQGRHPQACCCCACLWHTFGSALTASALASWCTPAQGLTSVRLRLEPLHAVVTSILQVGGAGQAARSLAACCSGPCLLCCRF